MMTLMMMTKWRQMVLKTTMTNMRITPRIFLSGSNLCSSERSPTPELNISYLSSNLASSILSQIYFVKGQDGTFDFGSYFHVSQTSNTKLQGQELEVGTRRDIRLQFYQHPKKQPELRKTNLWEIFDDLGPLQMSGVNLMKFSTHRTAPSFRAPDLLKFSFMTIISIRVEPTL